MDDETLHVRYLIVIAAVLCALIIGYNAFYVPDASMSNITVAADTSTPSGEEYTPRAPEASGKPTRAASAVTSTNGSGSSSHVSSAMNGKININTATAQQLSDGLDEIGDVMAKRIVAYREKNGRFRTIEQIKNVSGIGDKTFAKLKDHITI